MNDLVFIFSQGLTYILLSSHPIFINSPTLKPAPYPSSLAVITVCNLICLTSLSDLYNQLLPFSNNEQSGKQINSHFTSCNTNKRLDLTSVIEYYYFL